MYTDCAIARCVAITRAGHRCTGRWSSAVPCTFAWDPIGGVGIDGPWIVLCHRHRWWTHERGVRTGARFRVAHGWLGAANKHGYGTAVFARRHGMRPAAWWWARRCEARFGQPSRRDAA